jgi:hypothetical protein
MKTILTLGGIALWVVALAGCGPEMAATPTECLDCQVRQLSWDGPKSRGYQLQTSKYAIYTTAQGGEVASVLPAFMEASYRNYLRLLGLSDRPLGALLPVYLLSTREEWVSLTKTLLKAHADKYLQIQSGGYCYEGVCVFWVLGGQSTLSVAGHEGFHQFMHHRLTDQLPMWLEEGLCTQAEAYELQGQKVAFDPPANLCRRCDLQAALMRNYWISMDHLLPMDAGDAMGAYVEKTVGYYGQLWALVRFIRSDPVYSKGLDRLIADAEAGRLHEAIGVPTKALAELRLRGRTYNQTISEPIFRHYISDDLSAFEKQYKEYCLKVTELK